MNTISRDSKSSDFSLVPVARSYTNFNWERVAGPYAHDLEIINCFSGSCSLDIPYLSDMKGTSKFVLMSLSHSLTSQEEVSRFFQMTTFGPTKSMIDSWNYNASIESESAAWVKEQMNESATPMTSHRAFFRQNFDRADMYQGGSLDGSLPSNPFFHARHPCDQYARWREFAFTSEDYNYPLTVTTYGGMFLLSVRGIPRTLVSQWKTTHGQHVGFGQFTFCK